MNNILHRSLMSINLSSKEYFAIEALENGLTVKLSETNNTSQYRIGNGSWTSLAANTDTPSVNAGQVIQFKMNNPNIFVDSTGMGIFVISKKCNIKGNIMSLHYGDNFEGQTDLTGKKYAFYKLFYNCTNIVDASELILPATTLANFCYSQMFWGCSKLTTAPALPAITLAGSCYTSMFYGCTSLTASPDLPATTLADYCYSQMFKGCTGLTTAPELSATTLAESCYGSMFYDCTGLTTAPALPATTLASFCYEDMFWNCSRLTTAPELPATTLASSCYSGMFRYCSSLTTAPELPVTTLADYCYSYMFGECYGLTTAPALPATTLARGCYSYMFNGCTSLTIAPELPAKYLLRDCYSYMFNGCRKLNKITMLATTISSYSLTNWVYFVSSTGTFIKAAKMNDLPRGVSGIPTGWTVEDYII